MNIRTLYFLYFYILFTLFLNVNSHFFGKILFYNYFKPFHNEHTQSNRFNPIISATKGSILNENWFKKLLRLQPAKRDLFNNIIYNNLNNSIKIELNPNTTQIIDIILENTDKEIYIILEQIFYTIL